MRSATSDHVRCRTGHVPAANRKAGGAYTDGHQTCAFFLAWIGDNRAGFVRAMDLATNGPWSTAPFTTLAGKDIDTLWAAYQATL